MYSSITVPLENSRWDRVSFEHVRRLATLHSSELILIKELRA